MFKNMNKNMSKYVSALSVTIHTKRDYLTNIFKTLPCGRCW